MFKEEALHFVKSSFCTSGAPIVSLYDVLLLKNPYFSLPWCCGNPYFSLLVLAIVSLRLPFSKPLPLWLASQGVGLSADLSVCGRLLHEPVWKISLRYCPALFLYIHVFLFLHIFKQLKLTSALLKRGEAVKIRECLFNCVSEPRYNKWLQVGQ